MTMRLAWTIIPGLASLATITLAAACGSGGEHAGVTVDAPDAIDASREADAGFPATLDGNRDRLLASYLAYLKSTPTVTQSNGLNGAAVASVCDLWSTLAPSPQQVFL